MSQENVERIRGIAPPDGTDLVAVFGTTDGWSAAGLVAPDAEIRFAASSASAVGAGPEGFYGLWSDWLEPWDSYRIFCEDIVDRGDRVVMLVRLRGVTKHDAVEMEHPAAAVFRFEGDQVVEIEFTLEPEEAVGDA